MQGYKGWIQGYKRWFQRYKGSESMMVFWQVPIPGACAVITGIVGAGLPSDSFTFVGFLPPKSAKRKQRLESLSTQEPTQVPTCATLPCL
jgi:hypothetical protein